MTARMIRYTTFKTPWGHFGLVCAGETVCRTFLPARDEATVRTALLSSVGPSSHNVAREQGLARDLRQRIVAYYEGENVDFSTDPAVDLTDCSPFAQAVLSVCRQIPAGRTQTYAGLAERAGRPCGARAAGNALAANPIPLIVPCHRVLRTDGGLGGFSAPGGTEMKQRMLRHERFACRSRGRAESCGLLWMR